MNLIDAIKSGTAQERLRELFEYRDGQLVWRVTKARNVRPGMVAGNVGGNGYARIKVDGQEYGAHRLVWLFHHGRMPTCIDHIDGNPLNNRVENLREATSSQNCMNRGKTGATSPYKGVSAMRKRWAAHFCGQYLGSFTTAEEAARVYDKAAHEKYPGFARLNFPEARRLGLGGEKG